MAYRTPWPSVYPGLSKLPEREIHHLTIDTLRDDTNCIASVAPSMGIFSLICQKALKDTAKYIKDNKLTYVDSEQLIKWICERTFTGPSQNPASSNDAGPEASVCDRAEDLSKVESVLREETPGGTRGGGGGGKRGRKPGKDSFTKAS
jgi:hypothetical protein